MTEEASLWFLVALLKLMTEVKRPKRESDDIVDF